MSIHKPVLLEESIDALKLKPGDVVIDATLGGGGHSMEILEGVGIRGRLIAIDRDEEAIKRFRLKAGRRENVNLIHDNFSNIDKVLENLKTEKVNAILADFGLSSDQIEDAERGFSFQQDSKLDMRMDQSSPKIAYEVVNDYSQKDLERILKDYGDERFASSIAKSIVRKRKIKPIETTKELVDAISEAIPEKYKRMSKIPRKASNKNFMPRGRHFATKTFQAIRIEVNDEINSIKSFLNKAISLLKKGGRLAVITFHSGEDRCVKNIFRENARGCICPPNFPVCQCGQKPIIKIVNKKPITPAKEELAGNPRSRSSKLRVVEKR